jgi:hypothetical protein
MRIPDVQDRLMELADEHNMPELRELAVHLFRRKAVMKGRTFSKRMTDYLKEQIVLFHKANPSLNQLDIAKHFGVNPGRVSEAIAGKRE